MGRLLIHLPGSPPDAQELKWGLTRVGRNPANDITIDHPSISNHHCTVELGLDFVLIRDSGSTNGTFINGQRITDFRLEPGQTLHFGQVPVTIEWSQERVAVPEIEPPKVEASIPLEDGVWSCLKHPTVPSLWHCPNCDQFFCTACIRDVHLVGRPSRRLCPQCSLPVEATAWADGRRKKGSLWGLIKKTLLSPPPRR